MQSENFKILVKLTRQLDDLIEYNRDSEVIDDSGTEAGDVIRDLMDGPYYSLEEVEQEEYRKI